MNKEKKINQNTLQQNLQSHYFGKPHLISSSTLGSSVEVVANTLQTSNKELSHAFFPENVPLWQDFHPCNFTTTFCFQSQYEACKVWDYTLTLMLDLFTSSC